MRKIIRHASLFSGIGAPELAALWLGWQNVFHCEINEFCNTILNYWFPNSINYENIKTTDFSQWQGQIDILTGGFPCQPFSSAGQRLGADDDRYLWPEMLRVIRQIQPTFVIGENVAGILSMVQPSEEVKVEAQPLSLTRTTTFTKKNSSSSSKQSVQTLSVKDTPSSRLLFRLVPSVRPTNETECGSSQEGMFPHLLLTPCTREFCEDPASMRARAKRNGYKNGTKYNSLLSQVVYSDILPTPVTQGLKVCQDGKQRFLSLGLLPTPLAVEIQHSKRIKALKEKGGKTMGSRANGEQRPNGLMDFINFHGILPTPSAADATMGAVLGKNDRIVQTPSGTLRKVTPTTNFSLGLARTVQLLPTPCAQDFKKRGVNSKQKGLPEMFRKCDWLLTPSASDGMRAMMTMDNLKAHRKKNAAQSNLAEQIAHKIGGGTSQLSPLFVEEMMGYPLIYLVLPFLSQDGDRNQ